MTSSYADTAREGSCTLATGITLVAYKSPVQTGKPKKCKCEHGITTCTKNPINFADGNKFKEQQDISGNGVQPLSFIRYYNSNADAMYELGPKWQHNYNRHINFDIATGVAEVYRSGGAVNKFTNTNNVWASDVDVHDKLEQISSGWKLTGAEGTVEVYDNSGKLVTVTDQNGNSQTLTYDAGNRLVHIDGQQGQTLDFTYDVNTGSLLSVTDQNSRNWGYRYDVNGNLQYVDNPDGTVRQYHYENTLYLNALTGITDERGQRYATYEYDQYGRATASYFGPPNSNLTQRIEGVSIQYAVDSNGTVKTSNITDTRNNKTTYSISNMNNTQVVTNVSGPGCTSCGSGNSSYTYDPITNNVLTATRNGVTTTYGEYDVNNNPGYKIEATGTAQERRIDFTYDPRFYSKVATKSEASVCPGNKKVTTYSYDNFGDITSTIVTGFRPDCTAITKATTKQYNGPFHQISQIDGPRTDVSDITTFDYYPNDVSQGNNRARLRRVTLANGAISRDNIQYSASGKILSESRPNGLNILYTYYQGNDRLETQTQSDGTTSRTTRWSYMPTGEVESITLADGTSDATTETFSYDAARRLTRVTDDAGNYIQYTLDSEGNQLSKEEYDSNGVLKSKLNQTFDAYNRVDQTSGANANINYDFAPNGTLTREENGNRVVTSYSYDALKRLTTVNNDVGGSDPASADSQVKYSYDAHDNLTTVTDAEHHTTTYTYDDLGNVLSVSSPDTGMSTYNMDAAGNTISRTDAKGQTTRYQYDVLNRLVVVTYADSTSATFSYDTVPNGIGRLSSITDISGTTRYDYDAFGDIIAKHQTVGNLSFNLVYSYDAVGRVASLTYPGGDVVNYTYTHGLLTSLSLNGLALLTKVTYQPFGPISSWKFLGSSISTRSYDTDGHITGYNIPGDSTRTLGYDPVGNIISENSLKLSQVFGYDALNRITSANGASFDLGYTYDANGNRLSLHDGTNTTDYSYATNSNRLLSLTGAITQTRQLDANGNLINNGSHSYEYDARNRLKTIDAGSTATYMYNAFGQRVKKTALIPGNVSGGGMVSTVFIYDLAGNMIGEYDTNGNPVQKIIRLGTLPVWLVQNGQGYIIHTDYLGVPRAIRDSMGSVVWKWDSSPFGYTAANDDPDGNGVKFVFNLRFPGQYYDAESGFYYNYFRYYDPSTGRYITSDPIGLDGGLNTYGYVNENPLVAIDFYGLMKEMLAYEIEIDIAKQPLDGLASLKNNENYRIYVNVDDACVSRVKKSLSGWMGRLKPSLSISSVGIEHAYFTATLYEFVNPDGCKCDTSFSREEYSDFHIQNSILGIIKGMGNFKFKW